MQRQTQQEPAIAVRFIQIDTDALVIAGSKAPAFLSSCIGRQVFDDLQTVGLNSSSRMFMRNSQLSAGSSRLAIRDSSV